MEKWRRGRASHDATGPAGPRRGRQEPGRWTRAFGPDSILSPTASLATSTLAPHSTRHARRPAMSGALDMPRRAGLHDDHEHTTEHISTIITTSIAAGTHSPTPSDEDCISPGARLDRRLMNWGEDLLTDAAGRTARNSTGKLGRDARSRAQQRERGECTRDGPGERFPAPSGGTEMSRGGPDGGHTGRPKEWKMGFLFTIFFFSPAQPLFQSRREAIFRTCASARRLTGCARQGGK